MRLARRGGARSVAVGDRFGANQIARNIGAEMRRVEAAENSVPVSIVALRALQEIAGLRQFFRRFRTATAARGVGDATGGAQHFFVQQV